jgi:hypothetical protein
MLEMHGVASGGRVSAELYNAYLPLVNNCALIHTLRLWLNPEGAYLDL